MTAVYDPECSSLTAGAPFSLQVPPMMLQVPPKRLQVLPGAHMCSSAPVLAGAIECLFVSMHWPQLLGGASRFLHNWLLDWLTLWVKKLMRFSDFPFQFGVTRTPDYQLISHSDSVTEQLTSDLVHCDTITYRLSILTCGWVRNIYFPIHTD